MSIRFDRGRLEGKRRSPQGGLRVDAALTRTGIFLYRGPDGQEIREYRPPEEVFNEDSLESLRLAPIVVGHPAMIKTHNYKQHAVGVVSTDVRQDGKFVAATVVVQDQSTIEAVERGDLIEISCGYSVDLDHTPGVTPEGEKYDCIQRQIVYNHAALGGESFGRAGKEVRLRLDSNGDEVVGIDPTVASMTLEEAIKRAEKAEADLKAATARADAAEGARDAEKVRADKAEADLTSARTDAASLDIPALVVARNALENNARKVLGADAELTVKVDGKDRPMTDAEIVIATIIKDDPTFKADGCADGYLRGRFDSIAERTDKADAAHRKVADATKAGATEKTDSDKVREQAAADARKAAQAGAPEGALTRG